MRIINTNLVYKIKGNGKLQEIQFKVPLKTKYNLLAGLSATGKSTFESLCNDYTVTKGNPFIDFNKNKWIYFNAIPALSYLDVIVGNYDVIIFSEMVSRNIDVILHNKSDVRHSKLHDDLLKVTQKLIFISRSMNVLPIDFRSVYEIVCRNDIDIVQPLFTDTYTSKESSHYLVEDSKTGFEYYKHHFANVDTSFGRDKLIDVCEHGDTIIADGAALGNNDILRRDGVNLYLPESFEFDLARAWKPDHPTVLNYQQDMPDNTESVEQYFENKVLPDLCEQNHLPRYKKTKHLIPELLEVKIHKSTKDKLIEYYKSIGLRYNTQVVQDAALVNTSVTICEMHNINPDDTDACALLALKLKGVNL